MKEIPYFLLLVKKNVIIYSIIATGSFSQLDLKNIDHDIWSDQMIVLNNYSLNDKEKFDTIWITITKAMTIVSFRTSSSQYFNNPKLYFSTDTVSKENSYFLNNNVSSSSKKSLGGFEIGLETPAYVTLNNSSVYGYEISLAIYKKDMLKVLSEE